MSALDLAPGSPEWARRVSPSKIAAILGISPFDSQRSIWHKMRGDVPWDEENEAMERGHLLEGGVLEWWRRRHPGHTDWVEQRSLTFGDWCVATPDALTTTVDDDRVMVEAKTTSDMDAWGEPGTDEIPAYYLTQVFFAAHIAVLCGEPVRRIHVPVLGPRLRFENYVVDYDPDLGGQLLERAQAWHTSLGLEVPPPLDDSVATYDAIRKLHPEIDQGVDAELDEHQAVALIRAAGAVKDHEAAERQARASVIEAMGRAQYATCNGVRIARRQPRGDAVSFVVVAKTTDFATTKENAA